MNRLSKSEEDYLKALYSIQLEKNEKQVSNQQLANFLSVSPPSVNHMAKKLKEKNLLKLEKYGKIELTEVGIRKSIDLIRRHRLWETFLFNYLNFTWDEVHEIAEQLEHVESHKLVEELDKYMAYPKYDPHGAIIPQKGDEFKPTRYSTLSQMPIGTRCKVHAVKDNSVDFLRYMTEIKLSLGSEIEVLGIMKFDDSMHIRLGDKTLYVSPKIATYIYVEEEG